MPLYLAPYIGAGTDADPFIPRGSDQPGWTAVDMRGDPSQLAGWSLLYLPVAVADAQLVEIGQNKDEPVGPAVRTIINNRFNKVLGSGWTLGEAMGQLMMFPENGLKPLRPYKGLYEIWLNHAQWFLQPLVSGGASYGDDFNRADNPLGANWTVSETGTMPAIVGNLVRKPDTSGTWGLARYTAATFNDNQWASIKALTAVTNNSRGVGVVLRMVVGAQRNYYNVALFGPLGGSAERRISKQVNGVSTTLYNTVGSGVSGTIVRGEASGSLLSIWLNGALLDSVTDTSHSSGYPGCFLANVNLNPTTDCELDDWLGGDLEAKSALASYQYFPRHNLAASRYEGTGGVGPI